MANVIIEYRFPGEDLWHRCIAAAGEAHEDAAAALRRRWPEVETRQHIALCPHGIDLWKVCESCGRKPEAADKLLGS